MDLVLLLKRLVWGQPMRAGSVCDREILVDMLGIAAAKLALASLAIDEGSPVSAGPPSRVGG